MAGIQFTVTLEDRVVSRALAQLAAASIDMTEPMDAIGRVLVNGAVERIGTTNVSPDGAAWTPSKRATAKGGKTLHDTGALMRSINAWAAPDQVAVGTNALYAAVHQFGAEQGEFGARMGRTRPSEKRPRSQDYFFPIPWGDILARPYLGISDEEETTIIELIHDHFGGIIGALQ